MRILVTFIAVSGLAYCAHATPSAQKNRSAHHAVEMILTATQSAEVTLKAGPVVRPLRVVTPASEKSGAKTLRKRGLPLSKRKAILSGPAHP